MCNIVQEYLIKLFTRREELSELMDNSSPRIVNADQNAKLKDKFTTALK